MMACWILLMIGELFMRADKIFHSLLDFFRRKDDDEIEGTAKFLIFTYQF